MKHQVHCDEDLIAWQKEMDLAVDVYEESPSGDFARHFALGHQIHSSAISIPSSLAEGFERASRIEFRRFVTIAKGSAAELRTQIELARRIRYLSEEKARRLRESAEEVSRIPGALRVSLAGDRR